MKGKKLLIIFLVMLLAAAALVFAFRDTLVMYLAPKTVLYDAVSDAFSALELRCAESPLRILAAGYDQTGKNTTELALTVSDTAVGEISYDMTVQTDLGTNQLRAEGQITSNGTPLDVTAYLGREFAAVTSADLLQGGWYGITYDTFGADIRSFKLLDLLIPDTTIGEWENSASSLKEFMNRSYVLPETPEMSQEDIRQVMLAVLALKSQVSREEISLNGLTLDGYKITYNASGEKVGEILSALLPNAGADSVLTASFYLYERTLIRATFQGTAGEDSVVLALTLGLDASRDDLAFSAQMTEKGEESMISITLSTQQDGEQHAESVRIGSVEISYSWNPGTGEMTLTLPDKAPVSLILTPAEEGFTIQTKDFATLIGIDSQKQYDAVLTVRKGADVSEPEYKNLDDWAFEDLLVLLSGAGSLLGLNLK